MRILIVTPFFPPHNHIASLRPYSWAKYWGRLGHKITVYTTPHHGVLSGINTNMENVNIHRVPIPFIQNTLVSYSRIKKDKNNISKMSVKQKIITLSKKYYERISSKYGCFLSIRFPDFRDIWTRKIIKDINKDTFDMIVTTGCPYSVHRVGFALKKRNPHLFWIVDWRDLWTNNPISKGIKIFHRYELFLEKKFHTMCDIITTVSTGLASDLNKITSTSVEVVFNGFDYEDYVKLFEFPRAKNNCLTIAFTGTLIKEVQNINPLLAAISELNNEGKISPDKIKLIFAGQNCNIQEEINEFGIENYYAYLGFVPREKSLEMQYNADVVLFWAYDGLKGSLSGKIFEYLSLSREIWSIGMAERTDVDELIEKASAGLILGTDVMKIKSYIMKKISVREIDDRSKNYDFISSFERKRQAEKMLSLYHQAKPKC